MSSPKSIPHSPTPGKDPPLPSPSPTTRVQLHEPPLLSPPLSKSPHTSPPPPTNMTSMPPPPPRRPSKPLITTQAASSSNILHHPSLTFSSRVVPSLSGSKPGSGLGNTLSSISRTQTQSQLDAELPPRPTFSPFFTLINDVSVSGSGLNTEVGQGKGNERHPAKVHYIFSDDDTSELLTSSLLNSINRSAGATLSGSASGANSANLAEVPLSGTSSSSSDPKPKPKKTTDKDKARTGSPSKSKREDRVIIVDINETGDGVASVSSFSPNWQVLKAEVCAAPTFDNEVEPSTQTGTERGLMLRVEGLGVESLISGEMDRKEGEGMKGSREGKESGILGEEEMSKMLEGFDAKMSVLRAVVGARSGVLDLGEQGDGEGIGRELGVGGDGAAIEGPTTGDAVEERDGAEKEVGSG